jgi:hypothetical protein
MVIFLPNNRMQCMKTTPKFAALLTVLIGSTSAFAADWTSNSIGYRYAPSQSEPGVASKVSKNIFSFTHVSGDSLGGNFFTIDLLKSSANDPANGGGKGAQEWYGFYQRSFSISSMTGNKSGYGFVKDLSLTGRIDAGSKNTTFAPAPFKVQLGVEAAMPVKAGFWNVGVTAYKETNYNGIAFAGKVPGGVSFKVAPALNTAWAIPVGGIGTFAGFGSMVGPKGKDGFGAETKTETLLQAKFMFDIMGPKSGLTAGIGVEYWNNKFGCNNSVSTVKNSCNATTPLLLVEYKL